MSEDSRDRPERGTGAAGRAVAIVLGALFLVALYVASIGPAALLVWSCWRPGAGPMPLWVEVLAFVYWPLDWLMNAEGLPGEWLRAYVELWVGRP